MIKFITTRLDHQVTLPTSDNLVEVAHYLNKLDYVGLDLETTGLVHNHDQILLVVVGDRKNRYVIDYTSFENDQLTALFKSVRNKVIGHNLGFDLPFILHRHGRYLFKPTQIYDTMVAEQVITKGTKLSVSLDNSVKRRLGIDVFDKGIRMEFVGMSKTNPTFYDRHINYAAADIEYLENLKLAQDKYITRYGQEELLSYNNQVTLVASQMKVDGMYVDVKAWTDLYYTNLKRADELEVLMDEELDRVGLKQRKKRVKQRTVQLDLLGGMTDVVNKNLDNINYSSSTQVIDIFIQLGEAVPKSAKEDKNSIGEATLQQYLITKPNSKLRHFLELLLEYKVVGKRANTFGKKWIEKFVDDESRVHPTFKVNFTDTGRFSCIEENQLVHCLNGKKPIKDVNVGDYVYCYDDNNELRLRKVTKVYDNGFQDCISVKWKSKGVSSIQGELICTPDHQIKTKLGGWQRADELSKFEVIQHLYRNDSYEVHNTIRPRLFYSGSKCKLEQDLIKTEIFKAPSKYHIHHKNEVSNDNSLDNLEVLTPQEHTSYHIRKVYNENPNAERFNVQKYRHLLKPRYGEENHLYLKLSKYQVLKLILQTNCKPTKVQYDFQTFKDKCEIYNINLREVSKRFSDKGYISATKLRRALNNNPTAMKAASELGLGSRRTKELCEYYNVIYSNHYVLGIEKVGMRKVYDLEVEEFHNFIASDLCVHNCSNPNLQQIPSDKRFREAFVGENGRSIFTCDYSSAELRILASLSKDQVMLDLLRTNGDLHGYAATKAYRYLFKDETAIVDKNNNSEFRGKMKNVIFGLLYGAGVQRIAELLDISKSKAEKVYEILQKTFPQAFDYLEKVASFGVDNGYVLVDSKWNQRRWFKEFFDSPYLTKSQKSAIERYCKNTPIQAQNGQMMKKALVDVYNFIEEYQLSSRIISTVHDEMVIEIGEGEEKYSENFALIMKEAGDYFLEGIEMEAEPSVKKCWSK